MAIMTKNMGAPTGGCEGAVAISTQGLTGKESPEYVQCSTAAAMVLGLVKGRFWRGAQLKCINLLEVYEGGCKAACAYCGLNRLRKGDKSFIRVAWPMYPLETIVERLSTNQIAQRVCISMVTHKRAVEDLLEIARRIRSRVAIPISGLITPTLVKKEHLPRLKAAGIDKIGIAIDNSNPEVFDRMRGKARGGPHRYETYWERFGEAVAVFGKDQVGTHLILGLGDTEEDMVRAMQRARDLGGVNHLFSFFPEKGTDTDHIRPPLVDSYRRAQLAAEIIDSEMARAEDMRFDSPSGRVLSFGVSDEALEGLIADGRAFMTRGCLGPDGEVACNRTFANSPPGPGLRNYPFHPNANDLARIRKQLAGEWIDEGPMSPMPPPSRQQRRVLRKK